ncbi:FAD-binding oxidoreductase [Candidatus Woesearchaeota archaeon]|nr:FAD-binding oxidoreductase [Candidatus Woesearchaeota archaeon]MBT4150573.1 FAD-binding oxidoreductase [Candidatus Woesearchaeota archaeon]MBT4247682.1 FAD-binding oxidoreductase [Candidatus Woesearchaeota archaeon]MBT4434038.1 FAD-binding oxidoreductase [Candidatus Woesearchaeota archaeon]MBT7332250.1 FAD-binding oxidoreductase [Candidatus Woesearchaeota archaeon]
MITHKEKIDVIAKQLKERTSTTPVSLKKKSVSHQVPKPGDKKYSDEKIDVSNLNEIISIDAEKRICVAEPGVTFVDLVEATMKHNLVPIIVPELKTITIGGAVAGCSIESMSFKHGGFHDTCLEYEIITAKGEIMVCTPDNEHQLIFQMIHGTFGTLGIISKLTFRLIPAKPFVKVTYERHMTLESYKASIWKHYQNQDVDFMDGIIHSPTRYVLSVANFVDHAPYTHSYDWMRIYHVSTRKRKEDYLKTPDYFFRYEKGVTNVSPKSFLGRLLFGKFINSTSVLRMVEKFQKIIPKDKIPITIDTFIPFSKVSEFMAWYGKSVNFFPLWCVPYKIVRKYEWLSDELLNKTEDDLFIDLAIYGMKKNKEIDYYKILEDKLLDIGAIKTLISTNSYSESDFWRVWNKENYTKVKSITDPQNIFRNLYTKMCT